MPNSSAAPTGGYNVQCISGWRDHIGQAVPGSALEAKCINRKVLDAFILGLDTCPACIEEAKWRDQRELDMIGHLYPEGTDTWSSDFDPDTPCADNCTCKNTYPNPYEGQVIYGGISGN